MAEPVEYQVEITKTAVKLLRRLPRNLVQRITRAIDSLATEPKPIGCKRLVGTPHNNLYRIRVGDWRISYAIEDEELIVLVIEIAPRGDAYRK